MQTAPWVNHRKTNLTKQTSQVPGVVKPQRNPLGVHGEEESILCKSIPVHSPLKLEIAGLTERATQGDPVVSYSITLTQLQLLHVLQSRSERVSPSSLDV